MYEVGMVYQHKEYGEFQILWVTEDLYYALVRWNNQDDNIIMTDTIDEWVQDGYAHKVRYENIEVEIRVF